MKNEGNIDFQATIKVAPTKRRLYSWHRSSSVVEMNRRLEGVCNTPLQSHAIINMNGRIYDPVVGQFMQADNFIQTPEDYIGYNRYAYCRYNPFKYVDPSGESLMYSPGPSDGTCYETANPIIYYSRNDELQAEINAEKAEASESGDASFSLLFRDFSIFGLSNAGTPGGSATAPTGDTKTSDGNKDGAVKTKPSKQYPIFILNLFKWLKATLINTSPKNAYYKPQSGYYDKNFYVKPGYFITDAVDGVSTEYSNSMVFKMPDYSQAMVLGDGNVILLDNPVSLFFLGVNQVRTGFTYKYGWLNGDYFIKLNVYTNQWDGLFPGQRTGGKK